jgi:hypothetical protein
VQCNPQNAIKLWKVENPFNEAIAKNKIKKSPSRYLL